MNGLASKLLESNIIFGPLCTITFKVERNECKRLHALEFGQSSGFREKNSGLMGCVINPLSSRWAKEEGVGSKRLNSSKSTSVGNGAPLGKLSKESFLKHVVFYFLCYGPYI